MFLREGPWHRLHAGTRYADLLTIRAASQCRCRGKRDWSGDLQTYRGIPGRDDLGGIRTRWSFYFTLPWDENEESRDCVRERNSVLTHGY